MIGISEVVLILAIIALTSIFGRKTLKKLMQDAFGIKKDFEEVRKEYGNTD